jgi:hypothetical protein
MLWGRVTCTVILPCFLATGRPIDKIDNRELMTNIHVVGEGHMYCNLTMFSERKHGKITVHVTLPYNMDVGYQLSIIYCVLVFQWQEDMVRLQYM